MSKCYRPQTLEVYGRTQEQQQRSMDPDQFFTCNPYGNAAQAAFLTQGGDSGESSGEDAAPSTDSERQDSCWSWEDAWKENEQATKKDCEDLNEVVDGDDIEDPTGPVRWGRRPRYGPGIKGGE